VPTAPGHPALNVGKHDALSCRGRKKLASRKRERNKNKNMKKKEKEKKKSYKLERNVIH